MRAQIKCNDCGATAWIRAVDEPDVNAITLDDSEEWEFQDAPPDCEHEEFEIVEVEYDDEC